MDTSRSREWWRRPGSSRRRDRGHLDYAENTEYVACVVPAFTATGADSWNGSAPATCDLYDWWIFRTGPQGDFHELAAKLHKADLVANKKPGGKPFGRAEVVVPPSDDACEGDDTCHRGCVAASAFRSRIPIPRTPLRAPTSRRK